LEADVALRGGRCEDPALWLRGCCSCVHKTMGAGCECGHGTGEGQGS
jgi:hypothetical protein